ncbi:hypothetical protein O206_00040 [Ochrobactrum sp. EGD-AQ16]|nr:hypothetical protein O206_00040 [Ochrobactrum sp. EGD-AQ16]
MAAPATPSIDLNEVPDDLLFMTDKCFVDAAEVFYRDISFVQPSSDRAWVKRRFVDGLGTWPHIERADEALGGLISKALTIVARNPHFPPWWRSIGVTMMKGNPLATIRACNDVISYRGSLLAADESDIVDKNFDDTRDDDDDETETENRRNVIDTEPLDFDIECPPSLPSELWDRIPVEMRREAIIEMALGLRSGVHPSDTVETLFLKQE